MYSSSSCLARLAAVLITDSSWRDVSGALAVSPRVCGIFRSSAAASATILFRSAPDRLEQRLGRAVGLLQQGEQQVHRLDLGVAVRGGLADRRRERLLALAW